MSRSTHPRSCTPPVLLALLLACAGCGGGGGSSPTELPPPDAADGLDALGAGGADLLGEVKGDGAGGGGVVVSVENTSLFTTTGSDGTFELADVPTGDRTVLFSSSAADGAVSLPDVREGETIELTVALDSSGATVERMDRTGGADRELGELGVTVQPNTWNTNWVTSAGTVSGRFEGEGYDQIDPATIVLYPGDPLDPDVLPVSPQRTQLSGIQLRAFFSQSEVMSSIPDPMPGTDLAISFELEVDGEPTELFATVRIVGPELDEEPAVEIEKSTNGVDADSPPGPSIAIGDPVTWSYEVENVGGVDLFAVAVSDDQGVPVICPVDFLAPGESMTCTGEGVAEEGQYANLGTVTATDDLGLEVSDSDPSHYFGEESVVEPGTCGLGYWKNHPEDWAATGYAPEQALESVFVEVLAYPHLVGVSLSGALGLGGGPGAEGGASLLVKHGVPALLNAAHPEVDAPFTEADVIADVDAALASGDRDTMLATKDSLEASDDGDCPL